jgi:hypothetical protein
MLKAWLSAPQGKEPWNKGVPMSVETRAKMSAAKAGLTLRKGVRAKMSRAHTGKTHTEVCWLKLLCDTWIHAVSPSPGYFSARLSLQARTVSRPNHSRWAPR